MRRTFKYGAIINKETEFNAIQWLQICQTLYNLALEQRILLYQSHRKTLSKYNQCYDLPDLKKEFPEFKQVGSQVLQDVLDRLDKAYQAFFRRVKRDETPGFPRFKSYQRYNSFTLSQAGWELEGCHLYIKNVGRFKLKLHRPIEGIIKTITIKKMPTGKWFVSFNCDGVPPKVKDFTGAEVGIDVGLKSFITDSDGKVFDNPRYFVGSHKILKRRQRSMSRKVKGSNRRNKSRLLVAKTHEHISNQRLDFLHKVANYYIENYDVIYIENLTINKMIKNKHLSKSISDVAWGIFFNLLTYKAEEAGKSIVKVNPKNTSQSCSGCGRLVRKSLAVRTHKCPYCLLVLDRDLNASLNIKSRGRKAAKNITERGRGDPSTVNVAH